MGKSLYIAERPSVAQEFAKALKIRARRGDGYLESDGSQAYKLLRFTDCCRKTIVRRK